MEKADTLRLIQHLRTVRADNSECRWHLGPCESVSVNGPPIKVLQRLPMMTYTRISCRHELGPTLVLVQKSTEGVIGICEEDEVVINEALEANADCLFCLATQQPLEKADTLRLIQHLRADNSVSADGTLDPVSLCLLMALLYCFDVSLLEHEDGREVLQRLPMMTDSTYIPDIHQDLMSTRAWANPGLKSVVLLAWGVTLRQLNQYQTPTGVNGICEEDEVVINEALEGNVFHFLRLAVVAVHDFHKEEYYLKKVHGLVTDFIFHMPLKVKELRTRGDEAARIAASQSSLEPPTSPSHGFQYLLRLILISCGNHHESYVSLYKFVHLAGDLLPPSLYVPYIQMLIGLFYITGVTVSLYKFVHLAEDLLPPSLYVPYIQMCLQSGPLPPSLYVPYIQTLTGLFYITGVAVQVSLYKFVCLAGDLLPPSLYVPYIQMLIGLFYITGVAVSLYKFVRLAGDLLPPSLYVPYIQMLIGLFYITGVAVSLYKFVRLAGDLLPPSLYVPYIQMLIGLFYVTGVAVSLYKFVRLAGDLLPPSLYVPYIQMLIGMSSNPQTALYCFDLLNIRWNDSSNDVPYIQMLIGLSSNPQSAHYCFDLLKVNGMGSGGPASAVSWQHIFLSLNQYYASLRREVPSGADMSHMGLRGPHSRGITPQELEGLVVVLKLCRVVSEYNENCRVAFCENQQWQVAVVLFGLVTCSIPLDLKAEIFRVLAAFAKTPDVAASLWHTLEASQILTTVQSSSSSQSGIQVELEEVETRAEEFPMTRAFLSLLDSLTDIPVPPGLGAGLRAPGFQPYLEFVKDNVFEKFYARSYKNPSEKWEVSSDCVRILCKLLREYEVVGSDFGEDLVEVQMGGVVPANKSPGTS
ncbi:nuclear pore complex protein Nup205-like [Saccostrea cucullata]|uniref:nuclear pore complex protein Nup205-like n=1 Tax=Saccostrea cuccullata TaxID=36930 RepID=UPI002ED55A77